MSKPLRVLILGGGMGGLAVSKTLSHFLGKRVQINIFERFTDLQHVHGPRFMLAPNGLRILRHLGVQPCESESPMKAFHWRKWNTNRLLGVGELDWIRQKHGLGLTTLLRNEVLGNIYDSLPLGEEVHIHLDAEVKEFTQDYNQVYVRHPKTGEEFVGDILIACDGINSEVRSKIKQRKHPVYSGNTMFRGQTPLELVENAEDRQPGVFHQTWGQGAYFGRLVTAGELHWFFCVPHPDPFEESWEERNTNFDQHLESCLEVAGGWADPVTPLLNSTKTFLKIGMYYREPIMDGWHSNRIVLLGDSAHPMLPYTAQGANQATMDAYALAKLFDEHNVDGSTDTESFQHIFTKYFEERSPIATSALRNGVTNAKVEMTTNPFMNWLRDTTINYIGNQRIKTVEKSFLNTEL